MIFGSGLLDLVGAEAVMSINAGTRKAADGPGLHRAVLNRQCNRRVRLVTRAGSPDAHRVTRLGPVERGHLPATPTPVFLIMKTDSVGRRGRLDLVFRHGT